jgi:hypothetical protein
MNEFKKVSSTDTAQAPVNPGDYLITPKPGHTEREVADFLTEAGVSFEILSPGFISAQVEKPLAGENAERLRSLAIVQAKRKVTLRSAPPEI